MNARILREELRKSSSPSRAEVTKKFFKTAEGEYGHGDVFIGVRIPDIRRIAVRFKTVALEEVINLIKSDIHEERLLALIFLVERYKRSDTSGRKKIVRLYLQHKSAVNNWDLVDLSAPYILGAFTFDEQSVELLEKLLSSKRHWDRRMAMVATWYHIRQGKTQLAFKFAARLLNDQEDLMHKATGWMLREAGKRDLAGLKQFINRFGKRMPRTMLRYAIEKFTPDERKKILLLTKN